MDIAKAHILLLLSASLLWGGIAQGTEQKGTPSSTKQTQAPSAQPGKSPSKRIVAATVNRSSIYLDQVDEMLQREKRGAIHEEQLRLLRLSTLQEAIRSELLYQEALRHSPDDLEKRVLAREKVLKERHADALKGKDPAQIRENIRRKLAIESYLDKGGISEPSVSEAEIKALYEKQKSPQKEAVHIRHIFVQAPADGKEEERKKARRKAEEARRLLGVGKSFEEVAKGFSEDNAAQSGGDIGFVQKGFMPPGVDDIIFSLPKGKISNVMESKHGFHIAEVLEKREAGFTPYAEMRDWLRKYLQENHRRKKMEELLARLEKNAKVMVYLK